MKRTQAVTWARAAALLGLVLVSVAQAANPYVILPGGRKVIGTEVRATREGQIILTTPEGRSTFDPGTQVVMDEPADYAKALQQIQQKQYAPGVETLKKVIADYRFLGWDLKAQRLLGGALLNAGNAAEAVGAFEETFKAQPDTANDEQLRGGYIRALAAAGAADKLGPILDEAIRTGPRSAAAVAQVLRGDAKLGRGDIESALLDYVRTADFFRESKDAAAEAAFKAGECFEKLRDNDRAAEYYHRVVADFPDSPYAARAKAKAP